MNEQTRTILSDAEIILPSRQIRGSVVIEDGRIADVVAGQTFPEGIDLRGSFLIPGLIDIHSDYLEREVAPRPSAEFPLPLAFHYMDLRAVGCGLTTVLSAARVTSRDSKADGGWGIDGIVVARAFEDLRKTSLARHYVHVRWNPNFEPCEESIAALLEATALGNLVYNDNTPGERQFRDVEAMVRRWARDKNVSVEEARSWMEARRAASKAVNNRSEVQAAFTGRIPLGSHDDTTVEHVEEAHHFGATLAEMPCSIEAARKAKELGMLVCMGAPNYYRGGSHCGNLSCGEAIAEDLVDILCSDFHFPSMIESAVLMMQREGDPSRAINRFTLNPARHLGLTELGSIETGKRADLVAFQMRDRHAFVQRVWIDGEQRLQAASASR